MRGGPSLKVKGGLVGFRKSLNCKEGRVDFRKKTYNPLAFTQKTLIFAQN